MVIQWLLFIDGLQKLKMISGTYTNGMTLMYWASREQ